MLNRVITTTTHIVKKQSQLALALRLISLLLLVGLVIILSTQKVTGFFNVFGNSIVEIGFTILILDFINRGREDYQLRKRLLEQLGSRVNSISIAAAEGLWANGWWSDDSLYGAQLERANLRGVDFGKANLTGVRFKDPRYGEAKFNRNTILPDETRWHKDVNMEMFTNPEHPNYWRGYGLRGKNLAGANFENFNLRGADLRNCDLSYANLKGTDLRGAQMQGCQFDKAEFTNAIFDEKTILPNGETWFLGHKIDIWVQQIDV